MKIAFIGTGVMGTGIVNNFLKNGQEVTVYNRTKAHAQKLLDSGAKWADSAAEATLNHDFIFTMVGFPKDVEENYFGPKGILSVAKTGQILIDMTTSTPTLAKKIAATGEKIGIGVLDAPVSGGDIGARDGKLTTMVGGDLASYHKALPILASVSKKVNYFGAAGNGQHAKMANQIMIASTMLGLAEWLTYAKASGLDLQETLDTLSAGGADNWSMDTYAPRILKGDFQPGFYAKHLLKDLRIALDEADKLQLDLPATKLAEQLYAKLTDDKGLGYLGTQAIIKLWKQWA
ncbi:NAD(P)-dependent oxidoreductase [Oenococcus sicerae]|uniref:NAD(P)-dependent oxidoreductase n=1 Tax=Oenococcus sicerae TaxID=2203724 RepID=A0AAJ1VQJ0_9LACO|nr:NAD(P)-dependent oxidoreductase [Oenococcus sicerae]MDN6900247.1 NAD(P)-dependent oxidoreductase [Oenococcus sicerae]